MIKRIFVIGQCTMHWGRMEFGNVGNYYIVEPMFKEMRANFPLADIVTTLQFSKKFCEKYRIDTVPMELYYDFNSKDNLKNAILEYEAICNGENFESDYIAQIKKADLIIDFSGDIWGDNADFLGEDRFATGCYKDLTAQLLKPTAMIAGSPGPFNSTKNLDIARKAYSGFDFVSNREPISTRLLSDQGFNLTNTYNYPCPSFLFEKANGVGFTDIKKKDNQLVVGLILCGWNFSRGPFDAWPRNDSEYFLFMELIRHIIDKYKAQIVLLSHSNGFDVPPSPFRLKHGRDYPIMQRLKQLFYGTDYDSHITLLDGVYLPAETKAIISHFDILISGRMHGAVAGLSQDIPTLIIDYGHEPKAHKSKGFAEVVCGTEKNDLIANPNSFDDMKKKADSIIDNRDYWHLFLNNRNRDIRQKSREQFIRLTQLQTID